MFKLFTLIIVTFVFSIIDKNSRFLKQANRIPVFLMLFVMIMINTPVNAQIDTFTTAGSQGATGPNQNDLDLEYAGTGLAGQVTSVNGYQRWIVPSSGIYKISAYGAAGGGIDSTHRGLGGYAEGKVYLKQGDTIYVKVGQAGIFGDGASAPPPGGFGGGGDGGNAGCLPRYGSSGGGATDIRLGDTLLTSRILVAGGGGGATGDGNQVWRCGGGGAGGGGYYGGGGGEGGNNINSYPAGGGTQSEGGLGGETASGNTDGSLGFGGDGGNTSYTTNFSTNDFVEGGHGGGYTGLDGAMSSISTRSNAGGGGSAYIGGANGYHIINSFVGTGVNDGDGILVLQEQPVSCKFPSDFTVNKTTPVYDSVHLNWNDNAGASEWEVKYGAEGFTPGNGSIYTGLNTTALTISGLSTLNSYDFYVRAVCGPSDTSFWVGPVTVEIPFFCTTNGYCFTSAGASGATGPIQSEVDSVYAGTSLDGKVTVSDLGIQIWEVPKTGMYQITAFGAEGGYAPGNIAPAGKGAVMSGEFYLVAGDEIQIIAGQKGIGGQGAGGSGGGGSFVVYNDNVSLVPLIIAAGGSGAPHGVPYGNRDGQVTNRGPHGGTGTASVGAGGGFLTDGNSFRGGKAFINGGYGGPFSAQEGGFGGGGGHFGSSVSASGGGGYSGGDYSFSANTYGGGGSYNDGQNQVNLSGANKGDGLVIFEIEKGELDIAADGIVSPTAFVSGVQDLGIRVRNGINPVGSFNVGYQFDNNPPVEYSNYQPFDSLGNDDDYVVTFSGPDALNVPSLGVYQLTIWATNPNSVFPDSIPENDTLHLNICTPIEGVFVIDQSGAGDFTSFGEAFKFLLNCGLNGDISLIAEPGVYNESLYITNLGTNASQTLTIQGSGADITTLTSNSRTLGFENSSHITIEDLTIESTSDFPDHEALYFENADNITLHNNRFLSKIANNFTHATISIDGGTNFSVTDNNFGGGGAAFRYDGSGTLTENLVFTNNLVDSAGYDGMHLTGIDGSEIHNNVFDMYTGNNANRAIYRSMNKNGSIKNNKIINAGRSGIYFSGENSISNETTQVVNNMIGGGFRYTGSFGGGIFIGNSSNLNIFHNSIHQDETDGVSFNVSTSNANIDVRNNIFYNSGGGSAKAAIYEDPNAFTALNYNQYYSTSSNLIEYDGVIHSNIVNYWVASGREHNSSSTDPDFISTYDLMLGSINAVQFGDSTVNVADDFFGSLRRKSEPVVGAHEPELYDLAIVALIKPEDTVQCGSAKEEIQLVIQNMALAEHSGFELSAEITGDFTDQVNYTYTGTLGSYSEPDTVIIGDFDSRPGGSVTISVTHNLQNDQNPDNDTLVVTRTFEQQVSNYTAVNDTVCGTGYDVTLEFHSPEASAVYWYTSPENESYFATGNTLTLTDIHASITYFVEAEHATSGCISHVRIPVSGIVFSDTNEVKVFADSLFPGTTGDGTQSNPDETPSFRTAEYHIDAPENLALSAYGDTWEITSAELKDNSGNPAQQWSYAPPSPGNTGKITFTPQDDEAGLLFMLEITAKYLESGCESTYERYITVKASPVPDARFTHTGDHCEGNTVTLINETEVDTQVDVTYEWDMGDGTILTGEGPLTHSYNDHGTFIITLSALAYNGQYTDIYDTSVTVYPGPVAEFETDEPLCVSETVQFVNTSDLKGESGSYIWDMGDGNILTDENPEHQYSQGGLYTVYLQAQTNQGCTDDFAKNIEITATPEPEFEFEDGCTGETIEFAAHADSEYLFSWDFGDGATDSGQTVQHAYDMAGTYTAELTVSAGNDCYASHSEVVTVAEIPESGFTVEDESPAFRFTPEDENLASYFWNFGDGNSSDAMIAYHEYTDNGFYTVQLTTKNEEGCEHTSIDTISVQNVSLTTINRDNAYMEVYPNPAGSAFTIDIILESGNEIELQVLDITGRIIEQVYSGKLPDGKASFTVDTDNYLAEGFYIVRLLTDYYTISKPIQIIR